MSVAAMRTPAVASPSPFHVVQKPVICAPEANSSQHVVRTDAARPPALSLLCVKQLRQVQQCAST